MTSNPRISCIMTTFNSADYLIDSINSILSQSFSDFEFIISDWWSTDDTCRILESYEKIDSRIKILNNKNRKWISECLNDCMKIARWDIIAVMESDDISYKDRFQLCYHILIDSDNDMILTGWEEGGLIWDKYNKKIYYDLNNFLLKSYSLSFPPLIACSLFKKDLFYKIWWFHSYTRDVRFFYDFIFNKKYIFKFNSINKILYFKRWNPKWASVSKKFFVDVFRNKIYTIKRYSLPKILYLNAYYYYYKNYLIYILIYFFKKCKIYWIFSPLWRKIIRFKFNQIN